MLLTLIQNVALVVLLATVQSHLSRILRRHRRLSIVASGILYGAVVVVGMLVPFPFAPGIFYDGRSIILSLAGLFGGLPVALIAVVISGAYRIMLGGIGVVPGLATIVTAAMVGVGLRHLKHGDLSALSGLDLVLFGAVVHMFMLGVQYLLLPEGTGAAAVREVGPIVMSLFTLSTALAARMIIDQIERERNREALVRESERLRLAMAAADEGTWDYDMVTEQLHLSPEAAVLMGYGMQHVSIGFGEWIEDIHPDDRSMVEGQEQQLRSDGPEELQSYYRRRLPDGTYRWFQSLGTVVDRDTDGRPLRMLGIVVDITKTRGDAETMERRAVEAELLATASGRLQRCHDRDGVFDVIHDFFQALFPRDIVIVNEVLSDGDVLVTREVIGLGTALLSKVERLMGWTVSDHRYPVTPDYRMILEAGRMERIEEGLSGLAEGQLSATVGHALEQLVGVHEVWSIGVADDGRAYAGIHVLIREERPEMPAGMVESFANLCFVALARIQAQAQLAESEGRFRALIEQTDQGVSVGHPDGRILVYNPAMERISGYTREEVEREGWFSLTFPTPERQAEAIRLSQEALEGDLPYVEVEIVRKDGSTRWLSVVTTPVTLGGEVFSLSIFTDVTPRKQAEQALRESEARFRTLVETAPEAIFVQTGYRFAYVNKAACRLYGASQAAELVGTPVMDRFRADFHEAIRERIEGLNVERRIQPSLEMVHIRLDGSEVDVETSGAPITYLGESGAVVFVRDITAVKRAAAEIERHRDHLEEMVAERTRELEETNVELERATQAKSAFLARMSHELRTPLNSIIGFSSVMMQGMAGPLNDEQQVEMGLINSAGRHLLSIISDLLDLARIEAGRVSTEPAEFDAGQLVAELLAILEPLAAESDLELRMDLPDEPVLMVSDRVKVKQILLNLGGNAVKFTEVGRVEFSLAPGSDDTVVFSVADTGCGIAPDIAEHVFESFTQGSVHPNEVPTGTGLGLAISRELARILGGDIELESDPGRGSTFTLTLPRTPA